MKSCFVMRGEEGVVMRGEEGVPFLVGTLLPLTGGATVLPFGTNCLSILPSPLY